MKYPPLVLKSICKTPAHIKIYSENISEDGERIVAYEGDVLCNYQDNSRVILSDNQRAVKITGVLYIPYDIAINQAEISDGQVYVNTYYPLYAGELYPSVSLKPGDQDCISQTRRIVKGTKARNPDGTVNFVKIEVE